MLPIINILLIVGILLFILYNLYVDTRNWSNTGSFLEGMENAEDASAPDDGAAASVPSAPTGSVSAAGSSSSAMEDEIKARAGNVAPMGTNVPQNCKKGCVAPTGPNGNCKVIQKDGAEKRECGYGCPVPTLERGDTVNCKYDKDCNSCGTVIFNPDDPPQMPPLGTQSAAQGQQMTQGQMAQGQMAQGQKTDKNLNSPLANKLGSMELDVMNINNGSTIEDANNSLFNENIMKQVLAKKDLIPSDINVNNEETSYNLRIGKKFMIDTATIRNFALPNINEQDYIELGRIVKSIKMREADPQEAVQVKTLYSKLNNFVLELLTDSSLDMTSYDNSGMPKQLNNKTRTTGMFSENSNSKIKERSKKQRFKPYNSVWSLYH